MKSILFALLTMTSIVFADPHDKFSEGVRLYDARDFTGAIRAFESVLAEGETNGQTFFNLGNCYFRSGRYGPAILNYERAQRYLPDDRDLKKNLLEARHHTVDRIEPTIRLVIWDWVDRYRNSINVFSLAWLVIVSGAVCGLLLIVRTVWKSGSRHWLRRATSLSIAFFALCLIWYSWNAREFGRPEAVVLSEKSEVYSAPDSGSKQLFTLHEGTTVKVTDLVAGWLNVRLKDGREGWVQHDDVEQI